MIQNVLYPREQINGRIQCVAAAEIDLLVTEIPHDAETNAVRILAFAHKHCCEIDKAASKHRAHIDRTRMPRTSRKFLSDSRCCAERRRGGSDAGIQ